MLDTVAVSKPCQLDDKEEEQRLTDSNLEIPINTSESSTWKYRALGLFTLTTLLITVACLTMSKSASNLRGDLFNVMQTETWADGATILHPNISAMANSITNSSLRTVNIGMGCPEFQVAFDTAIPGTSSPFRSFTLTKGTGYAYVALHLSKFWMPPGVFVILRAVEGFDAPDRILNLSVTYPSGQLFTNIVASPILAKEFRLEFYRNDASVNLIETEASDIIATTFSVTDNDATCFGFVVDSYDYVLMDTNNPIVATDESICAIDNTKEAICYYKDESTRPAFLASRAVARLLIPKGFQNYAGCTGWLIGNEGHLMTNYHCVSTIDEASGTTVEMMAEANICSDSVSCRFWGACPGDMIAMHVELIYANQALDYALLKLPSEGKQAAEKYGYLRMKTRGGVVGEQLYIPQHPGYEGKRIALVDDYTNQIALLSVNSTSCGSEGYAYSGDTESGSSGSPVLSFSDHGVLALHHCGEMCANSGIPAKQIVADLQAQGIDLTQVDGVDDGSNSEANVERFPPYTPPPPEPVLPLTARLTMDGAIILASGYVSIDTLKFTLTRDTDISFHVRSVEIADNDTFYDLNGDCRASYLDAMIFLFPEGDLAPVFIVDDCLLNTENNDGSVSYRDPYKRTFLKKGSYTLMIAPTGATLDDALAGKTKAELAQPVQREKSIRSS